MNIISQEETKLSPPKIFFTDNLPKDTILIILSYLTLGDLLNLNLVSKKWGFSVLSTNDIFWKSKYQNLLEKYRIDSSKYEKQSHFKAISLIKLENFKVNMHPFIPFKDYIYYKRLLALKHIKSSSFIPHTIHKTKVLFSGGQSVGKTCLLFYLDSCLKQDNLEYIPGICETFSKKWVINDKSLDIEFVDMYYSKSSIDESDLIKRKSNNSLIVLCIPNFEAKRKEQLKQSLSYLSHNSPYSKFLLVRTKIDLINNQTQKSESFKEGEEFAKELNCVSYMEVSSKTGEGCQELMDLIGILCHYDGEKNRKEKIKNKSEKCILQ